MTAHTQEHRDYGFVIGLLTGTFVAPASRCCSPRGWRQSFGAE